MSPVLVSIGGLDIQAYGVSKALAAIAGALLLGRAFARHGLAKDHAHSIVMWATVWGFVGAKAYYLLEHLDTLTVHSFGGSGFTWYGGLIGGTIAGLLVVRRHGLPPATVAGLAMAPLSVAYAIGRVGCWLSGDGTYGRPTSLPWGMPVVDGAVPSAVAVHPTPLYEAVGALAIALALWALQRHGARGLTLVAWYLILSGVARFAVEFLRTNAPVAFGLTAPQLWALGGVAAGWVIAALAARRGDGSSSDLDRTTVSPADPLLHAGPIEPS